MATPVANSVALSGDTRIDALLWGSAWQFDGARSLSYAIHDLGFSEPETRAAISSAFAAWGNVANLNFQQVFTGVDPFVPETSPADMAVVLTGDLLQFLLGAAGVACPPDPDFAEDVFLEYFSLLAGLPITRTDYPRPEGDIYIDDFAPAPFVPGTDSFATVVHEIGHALGLRHPYDDESHPGYNALTTIMSGNPVPGSTLTYGNAGTPMPFDILAIQHIYGANMSYRAGDDVYVLSNDGVVKTLWDAGGTDTLDASTLGSGLALDLRPGALTFHGSLGSTTAIAFNVVIENALGSPFNDTLMGNDAANRLDGGPGADTLAGGLGNDLYIVDSVGDVLSEGVAGGTDAVIASVSHALAANVENLTLSGGGNISGAGNELANILIGNAGTNSLAGGAGNDYLDGGAGIDQMAGGPGDDTYIVGDTIDLPPTVLMLSGEPGNEILNGKSLAFDPGTGAFNITLSDFTNDGLIDTLTLYYLEPDVEHFFHVMLSTRMLGQNLVPGTYANTMRYPFESAGHPGLWVAGDGVGSNTSSGTFTVVAAEFDYTGPAPQVLSFSVLFEHSGEGSFPPIHGMLNINYDVGVQADSVQEVVNEGADTVQSAVSFTLPDNVENLSLTGGGAVEGTGNALNNVLIGNASANVLLGAGGDDTLIGAGGVDTLIGGTGDDAYLWEGPGDVVTEQPNEGTDTLGGFITVSLSSFTNVEDILLLGADDIDGIGNEAANWIVGNDGINTLSGLGGADSISAGGGADVLDGGSGDDTLHGGAGVDTAVYAGERVTYVVDALEGLLSGPDGSDRFSSIERVRFADRNFALDLGPDEAAGNTVRLIGAAFDAVNIIPEFVGIGLDLFDAGYSMLQVCALALGTPLWLSIAGSTTNDAFVATVYENIVGIAPTAVEREFYVGLLAGSGGTLTQAELLEFAADSAANAENIDLLGLQQTGVEFA